MKKKLLIAASVCLILMLATLPMSCGEVTPTPPTIEEPQYGGVLRVCVPNDVYQLGDPTARPTTKHLLHASPCVETLLRYDEASNLLPWLVASWEEDPEALTVILHLREGVKFHDGTDFNAEAVKFNVEREAASPHPFINSVESVDVVDEYTARINFSEWDNTVLGFLALFPGLTVSPTAMKTNGPEWSEKNPIGTGPFKFVSWERDVLIKYERFDDYWGGKPYLDGIEFHIVADPTVARAAFEAGEMDVFWGVSPEDARDLEAMGKYYSTRSPDLYRALAGDGVNPGSVYSDVRIRQAVTYAIDTQAICDALGYGYWLPTNQLQPTYPGFKGYNDDIVGYPYNPAKARELLAEAGHPDGFKTTILTNNVKDAISVVTAAQGYLSEVGIDAEIETYGSSRWYSLIFEGWEDALVITGWGLRVDPGLLLKLQCATYTPVWPGMVKPKEVDGLTAQALAAPDFETKKTFSDEAFRVMIDEYCSMTPLYVGLSVTVMHPQFHSEGVFDTNDIQTQYSRWNEPWLGR